MTIKDGAARTCLIVSDSRIVMFRFENIFFYIFAAFNGRLISHTNNSYLRNLIVFLEEIDPR